MNALERYRLEQEQDKLYQEMIPFPVKDFKIHNGPIRIRNQRKFRFTSKEGYRGDRLIVAFYEAYIKPCGA